MTAIGRWNYTVAPNIISQSDGRFLRRARCFLLALFLPSPACCSALCTLLSFSRHAGGPASFLLLGTHNSKAINGDAKPVFECSGPGCGGRSRQLGQRRGAPSTPVRCRAAVQSGRRGQAEAYFEERLIQTRGGVLERMP